MGMIEEREIWLFLNQGNGYWWHGLGQMSMDLYEGWIKIKNVIITQNMRPINANPATQPKPQKIPQFPLIPPHRSPKPPPIKPNKSTDKNATKSPASGHKKPTKTQPPAVDPQSHYEYFNVNKQKVVKNNVYVKNDDYCTRVRSSQSGPLREVKDGGKGDYRGKEDEREVMGKLKFKTPRGVIGFDGRVVTVQPTTGRYTNENRSLQQFTQLFPKTQCSRQKYHKAKSKSQPKRNKNKDLPKSQTKTKQQKSRQTKSTKQLLQTKHSQPIQSIQCRTSLGKYDKTKPYPQFSYQPITEPSTPHLHEFSQFYTEQFDTTNLKISIKNAAPCLVLNYLKRIPRETRSGCINFISKICGEARLSKDIFYLAVELIDRYCNQQVMLNKFKVLAIAALLLCVKFYDRKIGLYLNLDIFRHTSTQSSCLNIVGVDQVQSQASQTNIYRYTKKQVQKHKKEQNLANIANLLAKLHRSLEEELKVLPSPEEVLEFQTLILIREDFRIHRNSLAYWIDLLTLHWDRYLFHKLPNSSYTRKCLFRVPQQPQNYYLLTQITELCLHKPQLYLHKFPILILTTIFLLCRISISTQPTTSPSSSSSSLSQTLNQYKTNLQKSNNILFIDKYGINAIFGEFLELVDMEIGDILDCCKFVGGCLDVGVLQVVDDHIGGKFYQHYYNPKIGNYKDDY